MSGEIWEVQQAHMPVFVCLCCGVRCCQAEAAGVVEAVTCGEDSAGWKQPLQQAVVWGWRQLQGAQQCSSKHIQQILAWYKTAVVESGIAQISLLQCTDNISSLCKCHCLKLDLLQREPAIGAMF